MQPLHLVSSRHCANTDWISILTGKTAQCRTRRMRRRQRACGCVYGKQSYFSSWQRRIQCPHVGVHGSLDSPTARRTTETFWWSPLATGTRRMVPSTCSCIGEWIWLKVTPWVFSHPAQTRAFLPKIFNPGRQQLRIYRGEHGTWLHTWQSCEHTCSTSGNQYHG